MSELFRGVVRFEEAGRRLGHCSVEDRRVRGDGFGKVGLVYITRYNGGLRACVRGEEFGAAVLELRHNDARDGNDADIGGSFSFCSCAASRARAPI